MVLVIESDDLFNCDKCETACIKGYKIPEFHTKNIYCYACYTVLQQNMDKARKTK